MRLVTSARHDPPRPPSRRPRARSSPTTGSVYCREYGVDRAFEAHVGASVAAAVKRGCPGAGEGVWIVELRRSPRRQPRAHRRGRRPRRRCAGSCSIPSCADRASAAGWSASWSPRRSGTATSGSRLETFSELRAAAHIYRSHGFERAGGRDRPALGPDRAHLPALRAQLPVARPVAQLGERRLQRAALLGQRVGDPGGRPVLDRALDQARGLELAQAPREQPVGEARDAGARARRSSAGASASAQRIAPAQRRPISSIAAWKSGQTDAGRRIPGVAALAARGCPPAASTLPTRLADPAPLASIADRAISSSIRLHMGRCPWARAYRRAPRRRPRSGPRGRCRRRRPVEAANTVVSTSPSGSTTGPPELPLRTSARNGVISRCTGPAAVGVLAGHRRRCGPSRAGVKVSGPFSGIADHRARRCPCAARCASSAAARSRPVDREHREVVAGVVVDGGRVELRAASTLTVVSSSPATTWALVTTRPGPATQPEPSTPRPQAVPSTLTRRVARGADLRIVDRRRGRAAARRRRAREPTGVGSTGAAR